MQQATMLGRAPPKRSSSKHALDEVDAETLEAAMILHTKQETSSLRSTATEDLPRFHSPEPMSDTEMSDGSGSCGAKSTSNRTLSAKLPPIDHPETDVRLPSLMTLLAGLDEEMRSEPLKSYTPTIGQAGVMSPDSLSSNASTPAVSHKRHASSLRSSSTRMQSMDSVSRRPSTGERLAHITMGVGSFRMSSIDDYDERSSPSNSEDDEVAGDAMYKRSRMRTQSPAPQVEEDDNVEDDDATRDMSRSQDTPPEAVVSEEDGMVAALQQRRLAVICALMARANELYRAQLMKKAEHPAITRVKVESME